MLSRSCRTIAGIIPQNIRTAALSTSSAAHSHQPNAPLDLDPAFQSLLKDVDMSLRRHKAPHLSSAANADPGYHRVLELYAEESEITDSTSFEQLSAEDDEYHQQREARKSPAALFGSQRIGAVELPFELQDTIARLIAESDGPMVHNDAKRLFQKGDTDGDWTSSYDATYKSYAQTARHAERDGTAFASVALPSHYSAIFAVLDHIKRRIGPEWNVERVVDWGAGTGSGLWASLHSFQKPSDNGSTEGLSPSASQSTITNYLALDKRDGLVKIGKRLLRNIDLGKVDVAWQRSLHSENGVSIPQGPNTLALSAFILSSLPTPSAKKTMLDEMWKSGADVMVLIDHNTPAGFEGIAEAREYLIQLGKLELENPDADGGSVKGSHVVAPCPHDGACPIFYSGSKKKVVCGFSQRLQRPAFVRKTKHSGEGHEDTGYSYVVVRRGPRPKPTDTSVGRVGEVGKREEVKAALARTPMTELVIDGDNGSVEPSEQAEGQAELVGMTVLDDNETVATSEPDMPEEELQAALRQEAYSWPRLVFPPMKKSGHVILDSCTVEGKVMRLTVPKSQGKQPYYDARKSGWGDIFPHGPKNTPQVRFEVKPGGNNPAGSEAIKKRKGQPFSAGTSYTKLGNQLKERQAQIKRDRALKKSTVEEPDIFTLP